VFVCVSVCVCLRAGACVLPAIDFVITTGYFLLKQGRTCNSLLQVGFVWLGAHIKFVLLHEY
jgi:hypothetical protein